MLRRQFGWVERITVLIGTIVAILVGVAGLSDWWAGTTPAPTVVRFAPDFPENIQTPLHDRLLAGLDAAGCAAGDLALEDFTREETVNTATGSPVPAVLLQVTLVSGSRRVPVMANGRGAAAEATARAALFENLIQTAKDTSSCRQE